MSTRRVLLAFLVTVVFIGGCIFDDDDNDKKKEELTSINQLTMGGGVFILREQGYGFTQMATFYGETPYEEATVYINSTQLVNEGGFHKEAQPFGIDQLTSGSSIRISVYALGDSVVNEITIPEDPVIVRPSEETTANVGEKLTVEVDFPGEHQYIAITLTNQDKVAAGAKTAEQKMTVIIPGEKLPNEGTSVLSAYAANASGDIPEEGFDMERQYEVFLIASVVLLPIEFVMPE